MIDFGQGIGLCPIDPFDESQLLSWRNDPKVWRWTRQNDLVRPEEHHSWLKNQAADKSLRMYSVYSALPKTTQLVGVCGLTSIDWQNRRAEFSLYIAPEERGKKLATKTLLTLFYHGFRNLNLNIIWGETFEDNPAQNLFKSIGMAAEGRRRQFYWKDGHWTDALLFSAQKDEFLKLHGDHSCFAD